MDAKPPNRECKFVTKVHVNPSRSSHVIGETQVGEQFHCSKVRFNENEAWMRIGNIGWIVMKRNGVDTTRVIG